MVDELGPVLVGLRVDPALGQPGAELVGVARPELVPLERLDEADALPRAGELDLVTAEGHASLSQHLARDTLCELLDPRHRVVVVRVRLVPLEHRELGVVLERDALVAEVLADLVHALEPSDDEALEVELGRDPEVEVRVELVVMRDERAGERAAVARLEDRRLDLDEAPLVERPPDRGHDTRARDERLARLLVHQQVEVPLAVAELDVRQPVERVRQRLRVPREELDALREHGRLAATGLSGPADDAEHVTEMHVELAGHRRVGDHLDPTRPVDEVEEDELPHPAPGHRATGDTTRRARVAAVGQRLRLGPRPRRSRPGPGSASGQASADRTSLT